MTRFGGTRLAAVALLMSLVGCSGHHGDIDRLRKAANLDRCPSDRQQTAVRLPSLTLSCLGFGPNVRLRQLAGTPTLINVWGSWCVPCQREVPALQSVYGAAHGRLLVLGVDTVDDHASALDFAAHVGMKYPSVIDDNGTFLRSFGHNATPMTLFVDATGAVVHTKLGQFKDLADIKGQVKQYLGIAL